MRSINKCLTDIKRSTNIAIFTHMAPDADALASALALKKLIKCNNPNCEKIIDLFFDYEELGDINGAIIQGVAHNFERCHKYDLGIALDNIYGFIRDEFCDWYIEMVKPRLYSDDYETKVAVCGILNYVFGASLKLLHPFMPFVTTEIYSDLVTYSDKDLMVSKWPRIKTEFIFDKEENLAETLKEIIVEVRNIRAKMNVHPSKKVRLIFVTNKYKDEINMSKEFIMKLGFGNEVVVQANKNGIGDNAISIIKDGIELYMPLEGLVDLEEEAKRKEKEKKKIEFEIQRAEKMLSNPGFVNKAPQAKIDEEKALKWLSVGAIPTDTAKNLMSKLGIMKKFTENKVVGK